MQQYKDLHLATGIEALNRIALNNSQKTAYVKKPTTLMNLAKKIYSKSQSDPLDEEMTYILLCRFIQVYDQLMLVHNDKNFVGMMLGKEARTAKAQMTDLKNNLINRYEEANVKKAAAIVSAPISPIHDEQHTTVFNNALFISCLELFRAFSDKNLNLLIMDARNEKDFAESRIKDVKCINIPESCIQSGLSAHRLGLNLPSSSMEQWNRRDTFDVIILVDWNTSKTNYTASKLDKLRTILVEWDVGRNYSEKPVVLNDGYIEWLEMYPMLCTSSDVKYSKANTELDDLLNLDSIEYPTDAESKSHEVFTREHSKEAVPNIDSIKSRDDILEEEMHVIEQNTQVTKELLKQEQEWKDIHEKINKEYDITKLEQLKKEERKAEETISILAQEEADLLEKKSQLASHFNLAASFKPNESLPEDRTTRLEDIDKLQQEHFDMVKARQAFAQDRQRLLDEARQAKKPKTSNEIESSEKPTINRATKPKAIILPKIVNHIEGKVEAVNNGLTGLVNIKNTCYMNAIIQCLRHMPEIIDFYCNGEYTRHINRSPPIISNEIAHLIRALWSNSYSVIKPSEFYKKFTTLSPVYKAGYHEDCMEFFLQLYNYLSEDCALDISSKNFWSETQMAWYKQHGGKISFYINIFYHQIRIQHSCRDCRTSNLKFDIENIFYLPVPDKSFRLEHSMQSYLHSKEKLICKKCKKPKEVKKTISFYPSILIIALKRHIQDFIENNTVHYRKNENQCYFPVDDFQVGKCIYTLRAVALHVGNMQTGHYTAACLNPTNNSWYLFNDDSVSGVDINDPSLRTKAYAFFYSLKKNCGNDGVLNEEIYEKSKKLAED